ncbi:MAG: hypothetical protein V4850_36250 [Myxococcota bacterium]
MIGLAALLLLGRAVAAPLVVIDGPLVEAVPCATPAAPALVASLQEGVSLRWRQADRLFPDIGLERALVRRVVVRARVLGVCDGRVVVEDVAVRLVGPRRLPMEAAIATRLRPGVLLGVTERDVVVRPPRGSVRITTRDGFTAYGVWALGALRGGTSAAPAGTTSSSGSSSM